MKSRISILGALTLRQHLHRLAIATILAAGLLALARPAAAQIVYTPVNITLTPNSKYNLDLNNDGVTDFTISDKLSGPNGKQHKCRGTHSAVAVQETLGSGNGVEGDPPAELITGDQIGPSQTFYGGLGHLASFSFPCEGQPRWGGTWVNGEPGYLGLSFQVNGETYYGWAQVTITWTVPPPGVPPDYLVTLTGYAYESTPGMPINAGQTQ